MIKFAPIFFPQLVLLSHSNISLSNELSLIYADSLNMGDEARDLAIANAQSALRAAIVH